MFLLNSRLGLFTAACSHKHPFSLSYGVILPSSLTMVLSRVLGFSPRLPVSVCGTGTIIISPRSFSWKLDIGCFASICYLSQLDLCIADLPTILSRCLDPLFHPWAHLSLLRHSISHYGGTGISTSCPSATPFGLTLGPDLPREDEPSSGNLRLSTDRILTYLLATYTGILTSNLSTSPSGLASPLLVRSPTIPLQNPQFR